MEISYKLEAYEGPLDLLLQLIQKNKLNIYDIPIVELLQQYMDTIRQWQQADLDIATEFLEMAARLVQIKAAMLLPQHEEEAAEMRRQLSGELMEYQLCQEMAKKLAPKHIGFDLFVREPAQVDPDLTYRRNHPPVVLWEAYLSAAGRGARKLPPPRKAFSGIVERHITPVSTKIVFVLRRLYRRAKVSYQSLFETAHNKSDMVATFLAVLELIKASRIRVDGEQGKETVTMLTGNRRKDKEVQNDDGIQTVQSGD